MGANSTPDPATNIGVSDIVKNIEQHKQKKKIQETAKKDKKLSKIGKSISKGQQDFNDIVLDDAIPNIDASQLKNKDKEKIERMRARDHKIPCLLYPEDPTKENWDLFITLILLISCALTPYRIAFGEIEEPIQWIIIDKFQDGMFFIDIVVIFNSAYYDDEFQIVESRKLIAWSYIKSWLLVDTLAIVPFEYILQTGQNYAEMSRLARMGRMYKIIKMTRLLRILKIVKQRGQLLKYLNDFLKIGLGFERLFFFMIIFIIVCHIMACLWIITGQFQALTIDNTSWDDAYPNYFDEDEIPNGGLYLTSFYFIITTMTTVGYGDISGDNNLERAVSIVIMLVGVISFSFATGSLSSIMQNYDQANAKLQERITVLNRIYKEYYLPLDLYQRLKKAIKYDFNKDQNEINSFVAELPHKLKLEVSLFIHEQTYKRIDCFKGRSSAFIAWICPLLKPSLFPENQYIFFEGDDITSIYFLIKGRAGFVLPKYKNTTFIDIDVGAHFGIIDIVGSMLQSKLELDNWINHKDSLQRQFTIMATKESEVLYLSIQDLNRMKQEFLEAYEKLFNDAYNRLRRSLTLKLKAMRLCAEREEASSFSTRDQNSSIDPANADQNAENITRQLTFSPQENAEIKAQEIDYHIQAIQLNKIDEESVESSDIDEDQFISKDFSKGSKGEEVKDEQSAGSAGGGAADKSDNVENLFEDDQKAPENLNSSAAKIDKIEKKDEKETSQQEQEDNKANSSKLVRRGTSLSPEAAQNQVNSPNVKDEKPQAAPEVAKFNAHEDKDFDDNNKQIIHKLKDDKQVEDESMALISKVSKFQSSLKNAFQVKVDELIAKKAEDEEAADVVPQQENKSDLRDSIIGELLAQNAAATADQPKEAELTGKELPKLVQEASAEKKKPKATESAEIFSTTTNVVAPINFEENFKKMKEQINEMNKDHKEEFKKLNEQMTKMNKKLDKAMKLDRRLTTVQKSHSLSDNLFSNGDESGRALSLTDEDLGHPGALANNKSRNEMLMIPVIPQHVDVYSPLSPHDYNHQKRMLTPHANPHQNSRHTGKRGKSVNPGLSNLFDQIGSQVLSEENQYPQIYIQDFSESLSNRAKEAANRRGSSSPKKYGHQDDETFESYLLHGKRK